MKNGKLRAWLLCAAAVGAATLVNELVTSHAGYMAAAVVYLAVICLLGLAVDRWPVLVSTLVSAMLWNYLFIPPRFTLLVSRVEDILMLGLYFFLAAATAWAGSRLRANARILSNREAGLASLNAAASALAGSRSIAETADTGLQFVTATCGRPASLLLSRPDGQLAGTGAEAPQFSLDAALLSLARQSLVSGRPSGRFTAYEPGSPWYCLPLKSGSRELGVIVIFVHDREAFSADQDRFLATLCRTISIALEREILAEEMQRHQLDRESERLSGILLNSISHELRSPLTVIKGSASALIDPDTAAHPLIRAELLATIIQSTNQLNGIVENLLSLNRLESGRLRLNRGDHDPLELIGAAREKCRETISDHQIQVISDGECPSVYCDEVLIIQVLANLLDNAVRHGGPEVRIALSWRRKGEGMEFTVQDTGLGLEANLLAKLFSKFFRGPAAGPGGTGIGLSICQGIIQAHGGTIKVETAKGQGFGVSFDLPCGQEAKA